MILLHLAHWSRAAKWIIRVEADVSGENCVDLPGYGVSLIGEEPLEVVHSDGPDGGTFQAEIVGILRLVVDGDLVVVGDPIRTIS